MTGAGAANVAFADESSFATLSSPTWYEPGIDISVSDASLQRALTRARGPNDPRPIGSREGNREVALSISFTMTDTNFHNMVFADSGTDLASSATLAPTATWYLSADVLDGSGTTEERWIQGAAVESWTVNYQQGEDVTVDMTIIGAQEIGGDDADAPSTPGTINSPTEDEAVSFASSNFKISGTTVSKLQSLTLEVSGMARFRRGQQQEPVDAVVGAYEPSLTVQAILEDSTQRELGYGSSGATQPQDNVDKKAATLDFDNANGDVTDYNLTDIQPTTYNWSDLVSDTDITEPVDYHVRTVGAT